jgi:hypothetical protein
MTRALWQTALLLALPLLVGCTSGPLGWYYAPAIEQIRTDLPIGSSLGKVESYLDQHDLQYSYFSRSREITAIVHNVRRDALVQPDQFLVFRFDAERRLADIEANPVYTKP